MKRFFIISIAFLLALSAVGISERNEVSMIGEGESYQAFPLKGVKIGIDPGHQRKSNNQQEAVAPGSSETKAKVSSGTSGVSTGIPEYISVLEISFMLRDLLCDLGAEVKMTRETHDVDISNQERAIMMNEWGADIVIRVHLNGYNDHSVHGMGMYVRKTGAYAEESAYLGKLMLTEMEKLTQAKNQGVFKRDTYTGLNWSEVPCVLAELGYMSNYEEDEKLNDPEYRMLLVKGMVNGIIEYVYDMGVL